MSQVPLPQSHNNNNNNNNNVAGTRTGTGNNSIHYRSPFLSPLTPSANTNHHHHNNSSTGNHRHLYPTSMMHPYSPSFRRGNITTTVGATTTTTTETTQASMGVNNNNNNKHNTNEHFFGTGHVSQQQQQQPSTDIINTNYEWDVQQVHIDLYTAGMILQQRQLKCSAKFVAELNIGLSTTGTSVPTTTDVNYKSTIPNHLFLPSAYPRNNNTTMMMMNINDDDNNTTSLSQIQYPALFQYACTLLDMGDYAYAASILSMSQPIPSTTTTTTTSTTKTSSSSLSSTIELTSYHITHPLPNLSNYEIYIRSYALYMAGERCKEEQILEYQR
jgi:hypothetical protein